MQAAWIRTFALIAVAALLASAQCYGNCTSSACGSAQAASSKCHHQKSSPADPAPCLHQHSELDGPEAGIAKISLETTTSVTLFLPTVSASAAIMQPGFLIRSDTGSPPIVCASSTISVLRI
jgi:hypothetical protein